ncbi:unnamed protein product [Porites evermanni]|uniref:DEAD/DEAH-box helicase domain-containing protein n=1 Tax=Porites evermanni TaxID=104178 RepID=A0ABN8MQ43_9CNID|nr:unnamed protein product [Porites evermanni]
MELWCRSPLNYIQSSTSMKMLEGGIKGRDRKNTTIKAIFLPCDFTRALGRHPAPELEPCLSELAPQRLLLKLKFSAGCTICSVKDAITYGLQKTQYKDVREHQRKVIEGYCSGKDVFLSAPTGSGKSLTFEVAVYVFNYLERGERLETVAQADSDMFHGQDPYSCKKVGEMSAIGHHNNHHSYIAARPDVHMLQLRGRGMSTLKRDKVDIVATHIVRSLVNGADMLNNEEDDQEEATDTGEKSDTDQDYDESDNESDVGND